MNRTCTYLADWFDNPFWPAFSFNLKKEKTKNDYYAVVCDICEFAQKDFCELTISDANRFFEYLQLAEKKPTIRTLHSKLSRLRSVATYLVEHHEAYGVPDSFQNVFFAVALPTYETYYTKEDILTIDEIDQLLELSKKNSSQMFLIICLILRCGLTLSEVCKLSKDNIILDAAGQCYITLRSGKKIRYITVPKDVLPYLYAAEPYIHTSGALFTNSRGAVLSPRTLERSIASLIRGSSLEKKVTPQSLRTASVAYMLEGGASNQDVADYTSVDGRWIYRFNKVIDEIHPAPCELSRIRIL